MKTFIKNIFLFFLLFFILIRLVGEFDNRDRSKSENKNILRLSLESKFDSLDILFLGNSYCYSGINPVYFDSIHLKTFNLGIATAGINFYSMIADDYLYSARQNPKAIFILLSPMIFSSKADDIVRYPIHRYLNQPFSHENYILNYQQELIKQYPKILVKSFTKFFANLAMPKKNQAMIDTMIKDKGFVYSDEKYSVQKERALKELYESTLNDEFDTLKVNHLIEFTKYLKYKNINIVFFEIPSNKLNTYFNSKYMEAYRSLIKKIRTDHILIHNDMKLEGTYYRDMDHLNTSGAKEVTLHMIDEIKNNEKLKDILRLKIIYYED